MCTCLRSSRLRPACSLPRQTRRQSVQFAVVESSESELSLISDEDVSEFSSEEALDVNPGSPKRCRETGGWIRQQEDDAHKMARRQGRLDRENQRKMRLAEVCGACQHARRHGV